MKIKLFLVLALSACLITAGLALAMPAGQLPATTGKPQTFIQNLKGTASLGTSRCETVSSTSAVQKNYSTAGHVGIAAQAYNPTTGAAQVVKWSEDGKQVAVGSAYEGVNSEGKSFSKLTANVFSGHTTAFCIRKQ